MSKIVYIILYLILTASIATAQCTFIGDQYVCLPPNLIEATNINWDSLQDVIQAEGINWASLNDDVQNAGINWTSLDEDIQTGGINWMSLDEDIQAEGVNWNDVVNEQIKTTGINWTANVYLKGDFRADNYFSGDNTQGGSVTITVKGSDSNNCDLTFKDGLLVSDTCP